MVDNEIEFHVVRADARVAERSGGAGNFLNDLGHSDVAGGRHHFLPGEARAAWRDRLALKGKRGAEPRVCRSFG